MQTSKALNLSKAQSGLQGKKQTFSKHKTYASMCTDLQGHVVHAVWSSGLMLLRFEDETSCSILNGLKGMDDRRGTTS
jgi:hypothetical protein